MIYIFWISVFSFAYYSFRKQNGLLHFPFFFNVIIACFFGPQLNSFSYYENFSDELNLAIITILLSNLLLYIGFYNGLINEKIKLGDSFKINYKSVFRFSFFFSVIIFYCFYSLIKIKGGLLNFLFNYYDDYSLLEDSSVWLTFIVQLVYIVIPINLIIYHFTKRNNFIYLNIILLIIPLIYIIFLNRRFAFFNIAIVYYLYFYLVKGKKLNLLKVGFFLFFSIAVYIASPFLRSSDSTINDTFTKFSEESIFVPKKYGEINNCVLTTNTFYDFSKIEYGLGFIKQVFKDYVPGILIGKQNKKDILGDDILRNEVFKKYYYVIPDHEFVTGIGFVTYQFGFLGLIFWFFLGYYFKKIWNSIYNNKFNIIIYLCAINIGLVAIYYSPTNALSLLIRLLIFYKLFQFASKIRIL